MLLNTSTICNNNHNTNNNGLLHAARNRPYDHHSSLQSTRRAMERLQHPPVRPSHCKQLCARPQSQGHRPASLSARERRSPRNALSGVLGAEVRAHGGREDEGPRHADARHESSGIESLPSGGLGPRFRLSRRLRWSGRVQGVPRFAASSKGRVLDILDAAAVSKVRCAKHRVLPPPGKSPRISRPGESHSRVP